MAYYSATRTSVPVVDDDNMSCCSADSFDASVPAPAGDALITTERFTIPSGGRDGIISLPLPGIRCPTCAKEGKEVWVIPGRACGYCGTPCL